MFVVMTFILFLTMQPVDQRQHLSMCFDKLMTNINQSLYSKNKDKFARIWPDSRTNSATNKLWHLSRNNNNFMPAGGIHVFVLLIFEQKTKPKKRWRKRTGNQLPMLWKSVAHSLITLYRKWFTCSFLGWYHKSYWELEKKIENTEWLSSLYGFTEVGLEYCSFFLFSILF